ncbi:MAG: Na+/H+ antiporter NhaC [Terrisporobacter sp.]
MNNNSKKFPTLLESLLVVSFLIILMFICIFVLNGTAYVPLILAIFVTCILAIFKWGFTWEELEKSITSTISMALVSIIILMLVSIVIGIWMASGIVPAIIYYGLDLISPTLFLPTTTIICAVVSLGTGSSWTTVGTIGIALLGIGQSLGIPTPIIAGSIISGSYFGDKLSPLSDTTNLASAMTNTNLFVHIKHMLYTTIPSLLISILLYLYIGSKFSSSTIDLEQINLIKINLLNSFNILSPYFVLVPLFVIFLVVKKVPAIPSMFMGIILGGLIAIIYQGCSFSDIMGIVENGYISNSTIPEVNDLLTRGGLSSMMRTIALTICALSLGGVLEKTGILNRIVNSLLKLANTSFKLILTTMFTCFFVNFTTGDQYLSIVLPGKMYSNAYSKMGLHSKNLSRALEDSATLTSCLIPWNACGIYMASTLGVGVITYLPFAFVNIINPIISLIYAYFNIRIDKVNDIANSMEINYEN